MNIDLASIINYGNEADFEHFMFIHSRVHGEYAVALQNTVGDVQLPNFGLYDQEFIDEVIQCMKNGTEGGIKVKTWLERHRELHQAEIAYMQNGPDASIIQDVDMGDEDDFNRFILDHQSLHEFENAYLGIQ